MFVSIPPGQIALIRMPRAVSSGAKFDTIETTACLDTEYTGSAGNAEMPAIDAVRMRSPPVAASR